MARMLRACAPLALMSARASETTRSRVSSRRLLSPSSAGLNHSDREPASPACCPAMRVSLPAGLTVNPIHYKVNSVPDKRLKSTEIDFLALASPKSGLRSGEE